MTARFVDELPARHELKGDKYVELARTAQEHPERPLLVAEGEHERVAKRLRARVRPPFVQNDGRIVVSMRQTYVADDGRRGDIYLMWVPNKKKETK